MKTIVTELQPSQTAVGMTLLAVGISVEELARTVPSALRGHYEISVGNLVGSVLAFFLCNAGLIAVVNPLDLDAATRRFYVAHADRLVEAHHGRDQPRPWRDSAVVLPSAGDQRSAGRAELRGQTARADSRRHLRG